MKNIKVYCDTNILIDLINEGRGQSCACQRAFCLMQSKGIKPLLSTQSILDAAYIMNHTYKFDTKSFKKALKMTKLLFKVASISESDVEEALNSPMVDFEDAAQIACAQRNGCNIILSSDRKFKDYTEIPVYTPEEFVARVTGAS